MFLNNPEPAPPEEEKAPEPVEPTPEEKRAAFDAQTPIWTGIVSIIIALRLRITADPPSYS